jgi:hypothetical protein
VDPYIDPSVANRNVELSMAKIASSEASLTSLTVTGEKGIAIFDPLGRIRGSSAFALNDEGHILIPDVYGNMNMHGNAIRNAVIDNAVLTSVKEGSFKKLSLASGQRNSLAVFDYDGEIVSSGASLQFDPAAGTLQVAQIGSVKLTGKVDGNNQELTNVIISDSTVRDLKSVSTSDITISSLAASPKGSEPGRNRLVSTNSAGRLEVLSGQSVQLEQLEVSDLSVRGTLSLDGATIKNAKLDPATTDFGSPKELSVGELTITSMVGSGGTTVSDTVLLSVNKVGKVVNSRTARLEELSVGNLLSVGREGSIVVDGLRQSLVAVDEDGRMVSASSLSAPLSLQTARIKEATVNTLSVTSKAELQALQISSLARPGSRSVSEVLIADKDGLLTSTADLKMNTLETVSLQVAGSASVGQLHIADVPASPKNPSKPGVVLYLADSGEISKTNEPFLTSLRVSQQVQVDGSLVINSLVGSGHADDSTASKAYMKGHPDATALLAVDGAGVLQRSKDAVIEKLTVTGALQSLGGVSTSSLKLTGEEYTSHSLLSVVDGVAVSTTAPVVTSLEAKTATITNLSVENIRLTGRTSGQRMDHNLSGNDHVRLLSVDQSGDMQTLSASEMVQSLMSNLPPVSNGHFETLNVKQDLLINNLRFGSESTKQGGILTVAADGKVSVADNNYLQLGSLTTRSLDVEDVLTVQTLKLRTGKINTGSILTMSDTGEVVGVDNFSYLGGVLSAGTLKASSLQGDMDATGATLTKPRIVGARIQNSEIIIPESVAFGSLVVRSQSGAITAAASAGIDATGALVTTSIKAPSNNQKVNIDNAQLQDVLVNGGDLKRVHIVECETLAVSNDVAIMGNTNIEGNLNVQGSVVGSRPYMDSSDIRFKKDVKPIKNALEQLRHIDAVCLFCFVGFFYYYCFR